MSKQIEHVIDRKSKWVPPIRPEWLSVFDDFGEDYWHEPFAALCRDCNDSELAERVYFSNYQQAYNVPNEI